MNYGQQQKLEIKVDDVGLQGHLAIPDNASALVVFSHGSGSSRFSPRNNFVAQQLQRWGLATFLFDLLTPEEDKMLSQRFNIDLLSKRLVAVTRSLATLRQIKGLAIGYFGASTGAASALVAASVLPDTISAIVSRGGRPDLVMDRLPEVKAPTLFIVGEHDSDVIVLNQEAFEKVQAIKRLEIVKGATHLFEEPGALEEVAQMSREWFTQYLTSQNLEFRIFEAQ
jgi:putative phosphoribosyl transferase